MQFAISYLNNNNEEICDFAVILAVEVIKIVGREKIEAFLPDIKPELLESIWNFVTEWEGNTGRVAGHVPSPPPSPKPVAKAHTTERKQSVEDLAVDSNLLSQPLAKRGTVTRIEQQLNELRSLVNNTNNIIKDDYDTYIANSAKNGLNNEIIIENEELEEPSPQASALSSAQPSRSQTPAPSKHTESTNKKPAARGSKAAAPANSKSAKKPTDSSKTSTSKTSTRSSTSSTKKGSVDETKKSPRKNSSIYLIMMSFFFIC